MFISSLKFKQPDTVPHLPEGYWRIQSLLQGYSHYLLGVPLINHSWADIMGTQFHCVNVGSTAQAYQQSE